jgi:hypothetical protein
LSAAEGAMVDEVADAKVGGFRWPDDFQPAPDVSFEEWNDTFNAGLKDGSSEMTERAAYGARTTFKAVEKWYGSRPEDEHAPTTLRTRRGS